VVYRHPRGQRKRLLMPLRGERSGINWNWEYRDGFYLQGIELGWQIALSATVMTSVEMRDYHVESIYGDAEICDKSQRMMNYWVWFIAVKTMRINN
jgi:hypothetical protein